MIKTQSTLNKKTLLQAYKDFVTVRTMGDFYEENFQKVKKYVHATSRGHEAIQIALGMQLKSYDWVAPYYRDDALLTSIGMTPYDLMLQLLAKKDDPFSAGRTYYSHPSLRDADKPNIPHQSSATGMQGVPTTGIALGVQYKERTNTPDNANEFPVVVCSFGDASTTEGEVSEAFQVAAYRQLPILYLVQDNGWDISAKASETQAQNAAEYAQGFKGIEVRSIDGTDFEACYNTIEEVIDLIRKERRPFLVHATVPLLNHHTSGVRMEMYRDDLETAWLDDPLPKMKELMFSFGVSKKALDKIQKEALATVQEDFIRAQNADDPSPEDLFTHAFAPTPVTEELGERTPSDGQERVMVDCALLAIEELMEKHHECLLYGQDVGGRLGGVFREAATLAQKFGDERVFNTAIQEAFIVGSTVGMSAVGLKPIVEVQFADYIWPGLNQLFTEVARSCYLTNGKYPVSMILRVPIGAYGSGGPYHSSSVESVLANIKGIKIVYPSNGADMKGLMKAAYYDPNPVVMLEHKGLYWSKVPGTDAARSIEPAEDYILPLGKANVVLHADENQVSKGDSVVIITYGMGVHWSLNAAKQYEGQVSILDLRTIFPLDDEAIVEIVNSHSKCIVVTEEPVNCTFGQSLAGRIQQVCFKRLDGPIRIIGSEDMPAIPLNSVLEQTMIPNADKVATVIGELLAF